MVVVVRPGGHALLWFAKTNDAGHDAALKRFLYYADSFLFPLLCCKWVSFSLAPSLPRSLSRILLSHSLFFLSLLFPFALGPSSFSEALAYFCSICTFHFIFVHSKLCSLYFSQVSIFVHSVLLLLYYCPFSNLFTILAHFVFC